MKKIALFSLVFVAATILLMTVPGVVSAQEEGAIFTTAIDSGTFITVKKIGEVEVLSLR